MTKLPLISVIMSVYNGGKHIEHSVASILGQTVTDIEVIIIDDGSTDNSREVLSKLSDSRLRLWHQENLGLTRSLNRALTLARGRFIARQDADDISHPERLEREVMFLEANREVGLVGTYVSFIDDEGMEFDVWRPPLSHDSIKDKLLTDGNCFCHGSVMMRRRCLEDVGRYREKFRYSQDYDLWLRFSEKHRIANIGEILYRFRRGPSTISRKKLSRQLDYHLLAVELAKERQHRGTDRLDTLATDDIERVLRTMYGLERKTILTFKSEIFIRYFHESMRSGNYGNALGFWTRGLSLSPSKDKVRILLDSFRRYF